MRSYKKYIFMIMLATSAVSCKKYLDITPDNVGTLEYAFRNRNEAENYLFSCYATLQQLQYPQYNGGFVTSGEVIYPNDLTDFQGMDPAGFNLIRGTQTAENPGLDFWNGLNGGQAMFRALRRCNIMLENIDKPIDLTQSEKVRWIAEVKFLKAYYHFYLMRMYGPIPIIDQNVPITAEPDELKVKRKSVDEVVSYIVQLLDEAAPDLPVTIFNQVKELGRITQPIALSVKAEVLATAASPLFNGNPDYAGFKDKDGKELFSATYDAAKWDRAAAACDSAIKLCEANGYALHTFVPTNSVPPNLTDSLRTVLSIQTALTEKWENNKELIWALNPPFGYGRQEYFMPRLTALAAANPIAQGTIAAPISEQELFYTQHGVPINEDKTWDYTNRYDLKVAQDADRFYIHNGYTTVKAHFDREPRFYADLAFDGGVWYGNSVFTPENALYVQARGNSSFAGPTDNVRLNITGYWPKKLVNYLTVYDKEMTWQDYHYPLIRLGGLYVLYAECLNEQGKSFAEVVPYLDKVRQRAGLPGVVQAWTTYSKNPNKYTTKDGLRQIIHQESRIELAFESHPGWDLRRWKELQNVMSRPLQGWNIYEESAFNYYRPRNLVTPVFNQRNYLWPLKNRDLIVNSNLVQNPGW